MGLNDTPSGERVHIGFFGRRNAGKSSLVNAVTAQELAVVSDTKGTTTDPVYKAMELLPLGPVMIIDTPGFDDEGDLGALRVKKARQVLAKTDVAVLVVDAAEGLCDCDRQLIEMFRERNINYIVAMNKSDIAPAHKDPGENEIYVSAEKKIGIEELKSRIARLADTGEVKKRLVGDIVSSGDTVVLVVPIDKSAPKGRLILPQQQVIRDALESGAAAVVTRDVELKETLSALALPPALVVTDSQVFAKVKAEVPPEVPLTSFSILMARVKGLLEEAVRGACAIDALKDGDTVLIAEGCTHHRQCEDIGTVKLPRWLRDYTGARLDIKTCSGTEFPDDLSPYALVLHCGGCMLPEREVISRLRTAASQGACITNYGVAIAHMQGILARSVAMLPEIAELIKTP